MNGDDDENHEGREDHEVHEDAFQFIRIRSPLSFAEEKTTRRVIGSAIAVHRALGPGFLESTYRKAMCVELRLQSLAYEQERQVTVRYRNVDIAQHRVDLIVEQLVIVELKAVAAVDQVHRAQVISYLRSTRLRAALLLNFRVARMKEGITRIVL